MRNRNSENSFKLTQTDRKVLDTYADRINSLIPKKNPKRDNYKMIHK